MKTIATLPPIAIYTLFLIIAVGFNLLLNTLLLKFLKNIGTTAQHKPTNLVRWATQTKPAIGGISFFISFLLAVGAYFTLPFTGNLLINKSLFALLGMTSLGFIIGLVDDAYTTPPMFKFMGQLGCAAILLFANILIPISEIWVLDALFTTFWVVGVMNSINMLDNMDGVTASVSTAIVLAGLLLNYLIGVNSVFYTMMLLGVLAGLIGFLRFNWHPSKMYMGDSGSQFLGAFLSFISVVLMWQFRGADAELFSLQQFFIPALLFLLPITDTTTVFIRRIARGQSPFLGGRDHTTHHLAYCGLKDGQVAAVFLGLSLFSIGLTYVVFLQLENWNWWKSLLVIGYVVGFFVGIQWFYERGKGKQLAKEKQNKKIERKVLVKS